MMKKRLFRRKEQSIQPDVRENHTFSEQTITDTFQHCDDVKFREIRLGHDEHTDVLLVTCEGLYDRDLLNKNIIPSLQQFVTESPLTLLREKWTKSSLVPVQNTDQLVTKVFSGQLIIFIKHLQTAYALDISNHPQRKPEEASTEISIIGPRDGFIEDIVVNIALVRKRIRSSSMHCERFTVGTRSHTQVGLLYVHDLVRPQIVQEIRRRINKINIDGLFNSNQLEELLVDSPLRFLPMFQYTGRPDLAADALLRGRFVLMIDGVPTVLIAPVNFFLLLKSAEDMEFNFLFNSFERVLRLLGLLIGIFIPGFWVALATYHPDQIPLILLSGVAQTRQNVPFNMPMEVFLLNFLFELFREAGLRLPMPVGQILAVVGALIIGDAAIRANFTSPILVVIVASSAVATFTLVNQSLQGTVSLIRLFVLFFSSVLGMIGFLCAAFFTLIYIANLRSFGIPYLSPLSPVRFRDLVFALVTPPWKLTRKRPNILHELDQDKQGGER